MKEERDRECDIITYFLIFEIFFSLFTVYGLAHYVVVGGLGCGGGNVWGTFGITLEM